MITSLEQREIFHISFLRLFASRVKPNTYAVKGGVNLRLFFGSIRYSEDIDLDIKDIETHKLKDIVMEILASKTLLTAVRPFAIESIVSPDIAKAKQTETTQRFKVHLITSSSEDLFSKIEFSRRGLKSPVIAETIDASILNHYKLSPLIVPHYPAQVAIAQKIGALANRTETQARDIFDIYMLMSKIGGGDRVKVSASDVKHAHENVFNIDAHIFRDTVLNFLAEHDHNSYAEAWDEIQLRVSEFISQLKKQ